MRVFAAGLYPHNKNFIYIPSVLGFMLSKRMEELMQIAKAPTERVEVPESDHAAWLLEVAKPRVVPIVENGEIVGFRNIPTRWR